MTEHDWLLDQRRDLAEEVDTLRRELHERNERIAVLERHRDVWRRANGMILNAVRRGQLEEAQALLVTHDADVAACEANPMPCGWCVTGVDCPRHPKTGNEVPTLGLVEYAHAVFLIVSQTGSLGESFDDPGDAIAEAEELAADAGVDFFVISVAATDNPPVHRARAFKKAKPKARKRTETAKDGAK